MSSAQPEVPEKLVSQLLQQDPELRDIVEEFVRELDTRLTELRAAFDRLDWDQLTILAHRLKGAGGSYGFPEISRLCAELERSFRAHDAHDFPDRITYLESLVRAAAHGLNSQP